MPKIRDLGISFIPFQPVERFEASQPCATGPTITPCHDQTTLRRDDFEEDLERPECPTGATCSPNSSIDPPASVDEPTRQAFGFTADAVATLRAQLDAQL